MSGDTATTLIAGRWRDPDRRLPVAAPADGTTVGTIGYGDAALATEAANAAAQAFPDWSRRTGAERAAVLHRAAELVDSRAGELGHLLARESGKLLAEGIGEIRFATSYLRWFAEQARRPGGQIVGPDQEGRRQVAITRPAGVALTLSPWNFPVSIQARKVAPALAAGCTVVARVSEKAPLAVTGFFRCLHEAGMPDGVINLVHGPAAELTATLLEHSAVRVVSFTGSTEVGRLIMAQASGRIVTPLLELGGNAPFLVFDDADLDLAVDAAMLAKFRNNGQSCIAANRFLVQAGVHEEFSARLAARIDAMRVGDGVSDPPPDLGPLIDDTRVQSVRALVDDATDRGAVLLTKPADVPVGGSYLGPALLADVPADARLATEEVFGPAAAVFRFTDEAEAIQRANATELGLAAYFFTSDAARVWRVGEALDAGIVGVNTGLPSSAQAPMGGVKQSGLGREGGGLGMSEFEEVRYLCQQI